MAELTYLAIWTLQLSSEKHAVEADLKAERLKMGQSEGAFSTERGRLMSELAKARQEEMDTVRDLNEAQRRARDAAAARDVTQLQADERWSTCLGLLQFIALRLLLGFWLVKATDPCMTSCS